MRRPRKINIKENDTLTTFRSTREKKNYAKIKNKKSQGQGSGMVLKSLILLSGI